MMLTQTANSLAYFSNIVPDVSLSIIGKTFAFFKDESMIEVSIINNAGSTEISYVGFESDSVVCEHAAAIVPSDRTAGVITAIVNDFFTCVSA